MSWFSKTSDIESLRSEYLALRKIHHPDLYEKDGQDVVEAQTEIFKEITEEFEALQLTLQEKEFAKIEQKYKAPSIIQSLKNIKNNLSEEHKEQLRQSSNNIGKEIGIALGRVGGDKLGEKLSKFWS